MRTDDRLEHLCHTCGKASQFPECIPDHVEFGEGTGNDNIISCDNWGKGCPFQIDLDEVKGWFGVQDVENPFDDLKGFVEQTAPIAARCGVTQDEYKAFLKITAEILKEDEKDE